MESADQTENLITSQAYINYMLAKATMASYDYISLIISG